VARKFGCSASKEAQGAVRTSGRKRTVRKAFAIKDANNNKKILTSVFAEITINNLIERIRRCLGDRIRRLKPPSNFAITFLKFSPLGQTCPLIRLRNSRDVITFNILPSDTKSPAVLYYSVLYHLQYFTNRYFIAYGTQAPLTRSQESLTLLVYATANRGIQLSAKPTRNYIKIKRKFTVQIKTARIDSAADRRANSILIRHTRNA